MLQSLKWGRTGNDVEAKDVAEMPVATIPKNMKSPQPHQQLATQFVGVNIFSPQDTRVGKTKRDQSSLDIVTTYFDKLPDSNSRGRLMQGLLYIYSNLCSFIVGEVRIANVADMRSAYLYKS